MKKINWGQSYTRKYSIHKLDLYLLNMDRELKNFFPKGMKNLLGIGKGYDVKWHHDDDEFRRLGKMVLNKTLSDVKNNQNHIKRMTDYASRAILEINNFDKLNFSHQDLKKLEKNLNKYLKTLDAQIPIIFAPLVTDLDLFEYTKKILAKVYDDVEQKLLIINTPLKSTPVFQLEIDLLKILNQKPSKSLLERKLRLIHKKYYWLRMRFVDNEPVSKDYFIKQLNNLMKIDWRSRLLNYQNDLKRIKINFNKIIQPFSEKDQRFLKLVNEYSILRHSRDIYRNAAHYYGHFVYQEIVKRFKISPKDLLTYTVDELKRLIRYNKKIR